MNPTTISAVHAWEALDSRGRPTVGARVDLAGGAHGRAIAPSGASTGRHEARELRDGGERYGGYGTRRAVGSAREVLANAVTGLDAADRPGVDAALEATDPDPLLGNVGSNAVLAISLAVALAYADAVHQPVWRTLCEDPTPLIPMPMVNIVSGGAHAGRALDIQDVLAVPVGSRSFAEGIEWIARVRAAAADLLDAQGGTSALVADEGGLAGALADNEAGIALVARAIEAAGLVPGEQIALALDVAAGQFWDGSAYRLACDGVRLGAAELLDRIGAWCRRYPIVSVEDPLHEDDWEHWSSASGLCGQVLGDDLFATDVDRLRRGMSERAANAVLVKPNQAGTVTRAERVLRTAQAAGVATVVSARSGDTEDHWLADLAVGWRAGQIKVGSTMRSERGAKWNRLLEIESAAGASAQYAGRAAIPGA